MTISPPPINPIRIDPAADYYYIIAQQGASSMSVAPITGFTFTPQFGSPALLTVKWSGAAPGSATAHDVVITFTLPDGSTQTHTVTFIVKPAGPRSVPNIISVFKLPVMPGQPVNLGIFTDIAVDSKSAENLPVGISLRAGSITGNAPTATGFYVIKFKAIKGAEKYVRYFVLIVGNATPEQLAALAQQRNWILGNRAGGASGFNITTSSSGRVALDGDYTQEQVAGMPIFDAPFEPVDTAIYILKVPFWQLADNYSEPAFGTPGPFGGIYAGVVRGSFKGIAAGIIEWWREYVLVPGSRSEFESYVYPWQFYCGSSLSEVPILVHSRVQFDYFQTDNPTTIDLPNAPRAIDVGQCGGIVGINGWGHLAEGQEILAEDATFKCWKGNIYQRTMRFVKMFGLFAEINNG